MPRRLPPERLELPEGQEWFSLSDVARLLNKHKITVYNWERDKKIPQPARLKRPPHERRFSREQVKQIHRWLTETVSSADSAA